MVKKYPWFIGILLLVVIIPFVGTVIAQYCYQKNVLDNAEFWYSYMTYFGTVLLATIALFQSMYADEVNKQLMKRQLRQKIGYFELQQAEKIERRISPDQIITILNGYTDLTCGKVMDMAECEWKERVLGVYLKNVGEDIILNLKILSSRINNKDIKIPCSNNMILKNETICFEINMLEAYLTEAMKIEMDLQMESRAGICYEENIVIKAEKRNFQSLNSDERSKDDRDRNIIYKVTEFGCSMQFA